jgi:hypothetical protein
MSKEVTPILLARNEKKNFNANLDSSTLSTGDHIWYVDLSATGAHMDASKFVIYIKNEESTSEGTRTVTIYDGDSTSAGRSSGKGLSAAGVGDFSTTIDSSTGTNSEILIGPLESARFMDADGKIYFAVDTGSNSSTIDYQVGAILLP